MRALHIVLCKSRLSFSLTNFKAGRVLRCWDLLLSRSHTSISKLKTCFLLVLVGSTKQHQVKMQASPNASVLPIEALHQLVRQGTDPIHLVVPALCMYKYIPFSFSSSFVFVLFFKLKKIKRQKSFENVS